jgi:hypothetical protein
VKAGGVRPKQFQDCIGAQMQDAADVTDATAIETQWDDQTAHLWVMAAPGVAAQELASATPAAVALFTGATYAMLNDVPVGTSRAGDFFGLHNLRITCPSLLFSNISFETRPTESYICILILTS